jgi:hypothetical protein
MIVGIYSFLNTTANQNTTQNAIIFKTAYDCTPFQNLSGGFLNDSYLIDMYANTMPPDPGYLLFWNSSNGYNPYGAVRLLVFTISHFFFGGQHLIRFNSKSDISYSDL